ncbi:MAG: hypothetical protein SNJ76_03250 [Fimbriimonadaceae bacterium]
MRKAVLDVGSNSVLLLVEERDADGWRVVHESTAVTALGEGTRQSGALSEEAMVRTLAAMRRFFDEAARHGASEVLAAVTMAGRIARNTSDFLARAEAQGTPAFVLSGEDEAQLGFLAVAHDPALGDVPRISIIDVGGHSTELVTADRDLSEPDGWRVRFRRSFPIGTLAMLGGEFGVECPDFPLRLKAAAEIDDQIGMGYRPGEAGLPVALGATGTNLVALREKMTVWDPARVHGAVLLYEEISRAVAWLSELTLSERAALPGMEPGREKTIHAGALILERFLFALREDEVRVSVRGWRHALLERGLPGAR